VCVCVSVCERGRCLTTLVGCMCVYVCESEVRGRCLTTLVGCVCVYVFVHVCICWLFCFLDVRERNGETGEEEKMRRCVCGCQRGRCLTTLVGCVCVCVCVSVRREEGVWQPWLGVFVGACVYVSREEGV